MNELKHGCEECEHVIDDSSEFFGQCLSCGHNPPPKNINEVKDYDEVCIYYKIRN